MCMEVNRRTASGRVSIPVVKGWSLAAIAALTIATAGCNVVPGPGRERLIAANSQYHNGRYDDARRALDAWLRDYPQLPESAEAYYIRALCALRSRDQAAASRDLIRCLELSKRADLSARAQAELGDIAFVAGRYAEANKHFEAALLGLNEEPPADEIRYRYGISLQREARWNDARQQFAFLVHRYKGGRNAADVGRRFRWPAGAFAIQCGAFRDGDGANGLVKTLKGAKLDARSQFEGREEGPLHVVYVGQYASFQQAREALPGVRTVIPDAQVVP